MGICCHSPISKKKKRAKVVTGKTFTMLTATGSPNRRVAYLIPIVTRGVQLFLSCNNTSKKSGEQETCKEITALAKLGMVNILGRGKKGKE